MRGQLPIRKIRRQVEKWLVNQDRLGGTGEASYLSSYLEHRFSRWYLVARMDRFRKTDRQVRIYSYGKRTLTDYLTRRVVLVVRIKLVKGKWIAVLPDSSIRRRRGDW